MSARLDTINRPQRWKAWDFAGRQVTLAQDRASWEIFGNNDGDLLLLGLGPGDVFSLPALLDARKEGRKIYWLEDEKTLKFYRAQGWAQNLDQLLHVEQADALRLAKTCKLMFYRPGLKLAPDFWGPFLASLQLADLESPFFAPQETKLAWLPGNHLQLLHAELDSALRACGYDKICAYLPEKPTIQKLDELWQGTKPDLALSINFRGLDPDGKIFYLCRSLNIPLAIWLVDNPWHLLAGIRLPWWKQAALFVTDPSFIKPLRDAGAGHVFYCPLAASGHMWRKPEAQPGRPVFVGRSAFPEKSGFFRGIRLDNKLLAEARTLLHTQTPPDFHWWTRKLAVDGWPGPAIRRAGYGADCCSAQNRADWLKDALKTDLRIIGDNDWLRFFPEIEIMPPVDYYGSLPDIYNQASAVLNVTSFLLPGSLNQRHFDVWAAGGLLLTDATQGLDIFPDALTQSISMKSPGQWREKLEFFARNLEARRDLIQAWQSEISARHTYAQRITQIEAILRKL